MAPRLDDKQHRSKQGGSLSGSSLFANLATFVSGTLSFKQKKMKTSDSDTCKWVASRLDKS